MVILEESEHLYVVEQSIPGGVRAKRGSKLSFLGVGLSRIKMVY